MRHLVTWCDHVHFVQRVIESSPSSPCTIRRQMSERELSSLSRSLPFFSQTGRSDISPGMRKRIIRGEYQLFGPRWDNISSDAKELVNGMLAPRPQDRLRIAQIMNSKWISVSSDFMNTYFTFIKDTAFILNDSGISVSPANAVAIGRRPES